MTKKCFENVWEDWLQEVEVLDTRKRISKHDKQLFVEFTSYLWSVPVLLTVIISIFSLGRPILMLMQPTHQLIGQIQIIMLSHKISGSQRIMLPKVLTVIEFGFSDQVLIDRKFEDEKFKILPRFLF